MAAPPPARIRPYAPSDLATVRYLLGASTLEAIARSNALLFGLPLLQLSLIFVAFPLAIRMKWDPFQPWQDFYSLLVYTFLDSTTAAQYASPPPPGFGYDVHLLLNLIRFVPALGLLQLLLLGLSEWVHRVAFTDELSRTIANADLVDPEAYYAASAATGKISSSDAERPRSKRTRSQVGQGDVVETAGGAGGKLAAGLWLLEYGEDRLIGLVSLDGRNPTVGALPAVMEVSSSAVAAPPSSNKPNGSPSTALRRRKGAASDVAVNGSSSEPIPAAAIDPIPTSLPAKLASPVVQIRRITASLSFRPTGIEEDLVQFALRRAFVPEPKHIAAKTVVIRIRPSLAPKTLAKALKDAGFKKVGGQGPRVKEGRLPGGGGALGIALKGLRAVWPLRVGLGGENGWEWWAVSRDEWETTVQGAK